MATSFKTLRRYEKVGLIILGVVVMIFFTVNIDMLTGRGGPQQGGGNPEIQGAKYVTWRGGSLTNGQVEQIGYDHRNVMEVEQEIQRICNKDKKNPFNPKVEPIMQAQSSQDLARRYILASYANTMGLVVDDEAVISFLIKLGASAQMDRGDIKAVLDTTIGDTPEARTRFFTWMKRELAAKAVERMILSSQTGIAPQAAWEQFKKVTQQAQIEFLRLPVENYVAQVKDDPSDGQLKALYEKMKDQFRLVKYPDNGVMHAEEVAFDWVKADFETFVKEEMKNVTDEQVKEYYEKNKIRYTAPTKPPVKPGSDTAPVPEGETEKKDEGKSDQPSGETPPPTPEATEKKEESPAEKPADPPAAEPAKPESDPSKQESPASDPKDPAGELQVAFIGSEGSQDQEPKKPESGAQEEKPATEKPAAEKPAADEPAKQAEQEKTADAPASEQEPDAKPEGEVKTDEKPQEEFRPLSEVAEDIRRELASPKADQRYKDALKNAEAELRTFWKKVNLGDGKIDQAELKKFDLAAFAAKHGLTSGSIPLNPPDIVQTYKDLGEFPGFLNQAFGEKTMLYEPRMITNPYGLSLDAYIYWRTEQKDGYLPKFEECKDDLIKAYRYAEAKKLAAEDAKKKAAEVKVGKSLKETFPEEKVQVTGHFTFLTRSPYSNGVSRIPEIEMVDEKFMESVFALEPLKATSATVADESASYVIYLANYKYTEPELKKQYETYPFIAELARGADAQEMATRRASFNEFMTSLDEQYPNSLQAEELE